MCDCVPSLRVVHFNFALMLKQRSQSWLFGLLNELCGDLYLNLFGAQMLGVF